MHRPSAALALPALCLSLTSFPGCGKRADPLPPYVKTPQAPSGFEVAQIGGEVEIRVQAPRATTENRPLPVLEMEWMEASADGAFLKSAKRVLSEEVAPGELRVKRLPLPAAPVRYAIRARSGKAQSAFTSVLSFKPVPPPALPTDLTLTATAEGVELTWKNPLGAEPWPTPSTTPSPSPGSSPKPSEGAPAGPPSASPKPDSEKPAEARTAKPREDAPGERTPSPATPDAGASPSGQTATPPGPAPSPRPSPTPALTAGIRIFRTDGTLRAAREPLQASRWLDPSPRLGERPCYALSYAPSLRPLVASENTAPVCLELKDTVAPEAPLRAAADLAEGFVEISWAPSPSTDVVLYRVYRTTAAGAREVVGETPGPLLRVQDRLLTPGPRAYEVTALDKAGNESPATPPARLLIPAN